jgi:hypothetical protein
MKKNGLSQTPLMTNGNCWIGMNMTEKECPKKCFAKMNQNNERIGCTECHSLIIPDGRTFYQFCYDKTLEKLGVAD